MLYDLHEARRTALAPVSFVASRGARAFGRAPLAKLPLARAARAGYELCHRLTKDYAKPPFGLDATEVGGERVAVTERVILERPFCRLVRFERSGERGAKDPRVLVVAPLSGHHASLLRDTVRQLLPAHDVYVTDWIDAREVPLARGSFGLDDYVAYVEELLRLLGPDVHVLAVCQPAVPVLGAVALMAAAGDARLPRTMTLMGGPIDARVSPTEVTRHATKHPLEWFDEVLEVDR